MSRSLRHHGQEGCGPQGPGPPSANLPGESGEARSRRWLPGGASPRACAGCAGPQTRFGRVCIFGAALRDICYVFVCVFGTTNRNLAAAHELAAEEPADLPDLCPNPLQKWLNPTSRASSWVASAPPSASHSVVSSPWPSAPTPVPSSTPVPVTPRPSQPSPPSPKPPASMSDAEILGAFLMTSAEAGPGVLEAGRRLCQEPAVVGSLMLWFWFWHGFGSSFCCFLF